MEPNSSTGDTGSHSSGPEAYPELPGHYVVEREIGRGGMGTVLMAQDVKHGRKVAIKVLRPEVANAFGKDRFLREIRTVANLVHPNIVPVLDSGETRDTLYFVMPYVEGESLRERLERDGRMEVSESLRITREVAGALAYAHGAGVVHRDIKPENIILSRSGHTWLVDFGVARIATGNLRLTTAGLMIGSPLYASPEQTTDAGSIDGRSDQYSLGCVLYEMLTGTPPFTGPSIHAVLVQHHTRTAPSVTSLRPDLPAQLDTLLIKALAKRPEDRFASASALEAALKTISQVESAAEVQSTGQWRNVRRTRWLVIAGVASVALVVIAPRTGLWPTRTGGSPTTSDARYAILRFEVDSGVPALGAEDRLADALGSWIGMDVVEPRRIPALPRPRTPGMNFDVEAAASRARDVGARRYVHGRISRIDDSLRANLEVGDALRPNVTLAKIRLAMPNELARADEFFRDLADSVVLRGMAPECVAGGPATRQLNAIRACDGAFSALSDGDVAVADSLLQQALQLDSRYGRAALWLAELRSWVVPNPPDTRTLLMLALADSARLTSRERALAHGQQHLQNADYGRACDTYRTLINADRHDYVAWLGLGACHRRDSLVVRKPGTRPGYAFRSSYHQAVLAYRQAFELRPSLIGGYRERSFRAIRELLMTSTSSFRNGADQSGATFSAYPLWQNDTLAFMPLTATDFRQVQPGSLPSSVGTAIDRQRDLLIRVAESWARYSPASARATEALAVALELGGDERALRAIGRARALSRDTVEKTRLSAAEVWLRLKFGLPDRHREIELARALADSLVRHARPSTTETARILSALAALLGKPHEAAEFARSSAARLAQQLQVSPAVVEPSRQLHAYAALGAPVERMAQLETEVIAAVRNGVSPLRQRDIRSQLLAQAAMVAFPNYRFQSLPEYAGGGAWTTAEFALVRGDSGEVAATLRRLLEAREFTRPSELTIDALYSEAWLANAIGDRAGAVGRLDPTLAAIKWFSPGQLDDLIRIGTLLRAMALRAQLAHLAGDSAVARKWAEPVVILWSHSDPALRPVVDSLRTLTRVPRIP